jgi:ATP-binding protein involved in chromosome partitioning
MLNEEAVRQVLSGIDDPELKKSFTELEMVKSVEINDTNVKVEILLTVPGCPMKEKITDDITKGIKQLDGVESVTVKFGVMNNEQRNKLKEKLGYSVTPSQQGTPEGIPVVPKCADRYIAIASGKGGVGKSTITANLAAAMARLGYKVGVLDADVYGFSIPRMLGVSGSPSGDNNRLTPVNKNENLQVISMGFFVNEDDPVIWRGPLLHKAINQFLTLVDWDDLDFMFIDLPPGTGDVTLTIAQAIPTAELLVVTTPQATATHVAGRVAKLAERTKLKVIGVIENMAYYEVAGDKDYVFGKDGGKELAKNLGVAMLGEIPLMKSIREGGDNGKPPATDGNEKEISLFESLAKSIQKM